MKHMDAMLIQWKNEIPETGIQVQNTFWFPDDQALITASEVVHATFCHLNLIIS
jgi:hypothetical protein